MSTTFAGVEAPAGRYEGVTRPYTEQDVHRLRGSVKVENTLAQLGADNLWRLLKTERYVHALGALSGNQVGAGAGASASRELCQAHVAAASH